MLALSGDEILLGEAAELGPIDPQLKIVVDQRSVTVPAGAALAQFAQIHAEITADPNKMRGWLPILRQYGPSFLQECVNAVMLSETLVGDWLTRYMFKGESQAEERAKKVAKWLAKHENFNMHARPVWPDQLLEIEPGMKIRKLSDIGKEFEAAVMATYWAIDITFASTPAFKIIEHKAASAYIRLMNVVVQPAEPSNRQAKRKRTGINR